MVCHPLNDACFDLAHELSYSYTCDSLLVLATKNPKTFLWQKSRAVAHVISCLKYRQHVAKFNFMNILQHCLSKYCC